MGSSARATEFLKECMSDSLIKLANQKPFDKITVDEITKGAGVHRTTWFRNFSSKNEAVTFKLIQEWNRWADEHELKERSRFSMENAFDFFQFNSEIQGLLLSIYHAGLQSAVYDAFHQIMMPLHGSSPKECYQGRFYSYGLFGLLDEWIRRGFCESPEDMAYLLREIIL